MSAKEFLERLVGDLTEVVADKDTLRKIWSDPDTRGRFLKQLGDRGYDAERLKVIRGLVNAPQSDLFDVLNYALFTTPTKTGIERADDLRSSDSGLANEEVRDLLLGILAAYEQSGESELATDKLGQFLATRYGSVSEGKNTFGGLKPIRDAFRSMQKALYSE